jgi:hypothetical protein
MVLATMLSTAKKEHPKRPNLALNHQKTCHNGEWKMFTATNFFRE